MKQIKFRAWNPETKSIDYFDLEEAAGDVHIAERLLLLMANTHPKGKDLLMQFTGLTDKNGVDIYEKDICYVEGQGNCFVELCMFSGVEFHHVDGNSASALDCMSEQDLFEVIGNLYENKELLEG